MQPSRDGARSPSNNGGRLRARQRVPRDQLRAKLEKVELDADRRRAHSADAVELGLLARVLGDALARLIALIEQLDLLELLEGFGERHAGVFELALQFVGRALEIVAPPDRRLGVGR